MALRWRLSSLLTCARRQHPGSVSSLPTCETMCVTPHKTPTMRIHYYQPKAGELPRKLA